MDSLMQLSDHGQSYWLDNLTREMIEEGDLTRRVREEGLRGVTSNPSIFQAAISGGTAYDGQVEELAREGLGAREIYEALVVKDIQSACDILWPVYEETGGTDGFVSLEVSPYLVHDTDATQAEARRLFSAVDRPNVLIKIPGSPSGFTAIEEMLYEGVNVNITLLFSISAYKAVADAYLNALERRIDEGKPVDGIGSVASFFLSRIDVLTDGLLGQRIRPEAQSDGSPDPETLMGRAAVANAKLAYQSFKEKFSGPRWERIAQEGGKVQRVLWASTSTKNPLYSDVRYIEPLIGPDTVNTLPDESISAFADHGIVRAGTVEEDLDEAREVLKGLEEVGINFDAVTWQLLNEGMEKFTEPYDRLLNTLEEARESVLGPSASHPVIRGTADQEDTLRALQELRFAHRLHAGDPRLWTWDPEEAKAVSNRLGWLRCTSDFKPRTDMLSDFGQEVRDEGTRWIVLLGMGGSSLWPEVCTRVFEARPQGPELVVLDSTDPDAIRSVEERIDPERTVFVVSSKSGTTTETLSLYHAFFSLVKDRMASDDPGERFIAITDPGSPLAEEARDRGFRRVFTNPEDIGGRYSALSYFGLVPMALLGLDLEKFLEKADRQLTSCGGGLPAGANSGVSLGAALGTLARKGRDKLTFLAHPGLEPFTLWVEQLLAESTGKDGVGILPVAQEPPAPASEYGTDRVFVYLEGGGARDEKAEARLDALSDAGHPVIRMEVAGPQGLGAEIIRWEVATATAGAILGVNPFDEPNVAESKQNTSELLDQWADSGGMGEPEPAAEEGGVGAWAGNSALERDTPLEMVHALLDTLSPGDYLAVLAYLRETEHRTGIFQAFRSKVRARHGVATTLGYGPRYLHSTGQLHKGGPDRGAYLVVTADAADGIGIPGEEHDFATLIQAQALGDFRALSQRNGRVVRLHLGAPADRKLSSFFGGLG